MDLETTMLEEKVELLRKRLKRRNVLLDETRKAYLRDVVAVNEAMRRSEQSPTTTATVSSSLDLRSTLELYAPSECSFRVAHGGKLDDYGGHVEIIHRESGKVVVLRKKVEELMELEQQMRLKATELEILQQKDQLALIDQREQNRDDRTILSREIWSLKQKLEKIDETELDTLRRENTKLRRRLEDGESKCRDFERVAEELRRTAEARDKLELQCKGKDLRVTESDRQMQRARELAEEEIARYNELELKYTQEREEKEVIQQKLDDANRDTRAERRELNKTQKTLDSVRKVEVELRQELADLKAEFTDAREIEEQEQEALRMTANELRRDNAKAKEKADGAEQALLKAQEANILAMEKLRKETISELESRHAEELRIALRDQLRSKAVERAQAALLDDVRESLELNGSRLRSHLEEHDKSSLATISSSRSSPSSETRIGTCVSSPHHSSHRKLVNALADATEEIANIQTKLDMISLIDKEETSAGKDREVVEQSSNENKIVDKFGEVVQQSPNENTLVDKAGRNNHKKVAAATAATEKASEHLLVAKLRAQIVSLEEDLEAAQREIKEMTASKKDARMRQNFLTQSEQEGSQSVSQVMSLVEVLEDVSSTSPGMTSELEDFAKEHQFLTQESIQSGGTTGKDQIEAIHRAGKLEQAVKLIKLRIATQLKKQTNTVTESKTGNSSSSAMSSTAPVVVESTIDEPRLALPPLQRASTVPSNMTAHKSEEVAALRSELAAMKGEVFDAKELKRSFDELDKKQKQTEKQMVELRLENETLRRERRRLEEVHVDADSSFASICAEKAVLESEMKRSLQRASNLQGELHRVQSGLDDVINRERIRLETSSSIETQFNPHLHSVGIQTTFQTPNMTLRRINSFTYVPHHRCGPVTVTPAIDDDKTPECTPLFVKPDASSGNIFREKRQGPFGTEQTTLSRRRSEDIGQRLLPTLLKREIYSR